jgi:hypothetical protein
VEQVDVGQECAPVRWEPAHQRQAGGKVHLIVWWPNCWHFPHLVEGPKRSLRSALRVEEKAKSRRREATSWALFPVKVITTEEAFFSLRCSCLVSHLGVDAIMRPGL